MDPEPFSSHNPSKYHCSWTPARGAGTYLLGGGFGNEAWTSDLVKPDGTVEESFRLKHKTLYAVKINICMNDYAPINSTHHPFQPRMLYSRR